MRAYSGVGAECKALGPDFTALPKITRLGNMTRLGEAFMLKLFNYLNGVFYVCYGLFGLFQPKTMASAMGWEPSLLGLHEVRAIWAAVAAIGVLLCLNISQNRDQRLIAMMLIFITLSFAAGRLIGILLDGAGPQLTYMELALEAFTVTFGAIALKLDQKKA
jgi:hydrogenase/urease accessory protein HupE